MKDFLHSEVPVLCPVGVNARLNPFSKTSSTQASTNQQVGVQGGVGISGSYGAGATVNIVNSDADTVQAALEGMTEVATEGIAGATATSLGALSALVRTQEFSNQLTLEAVKGAQTVALTATPRDPGQQVETVLATQKQMFAILAIGGVAFLIFGPKLR